MTTRAKKGQPSRLKLDVPWQDAAAKLLTAKPKETPPRVVKKRQTKKSAVKKK